MSAQQRKRLYWTNIKGVQQPEDKGILLKDVLESGLSFSDKSYCITATYAGATFEQTLRDKKRTTIAEPIALASKSQTILSTIHKENASSLIKRKKMGLFVAQKYRKHRKFQNQILMLLELPFVLVRMKTAVLSVLKCLEMENQTL